MVRGSLTGKVASEQRPGGGEEVSPRALGRMAFQGREQAQRSGRESLLEMMRGNRNLGIAGVV